MWSRIHLLTFVTIAIAIATGVNIPCDLRDTEDGKVCVCSAEYCDFLENPIPANENEIIIVSSTKAGLRFNVTTGGFPTKNTEGQEQKTFVVEDKKTMDDNDNHRATSSTRNVILTIEREKQYQKIVGFGGSYTGSTSYLLDQLPQQLQDNIFKSYYGDDGIGFNLIRIPIGGCDFDLAPWAYNELPENDLQLSNFTTLDSRDVLRLSQIKRTIEVAQPHNLRIKGAAWSPPPWMKSNNDWTGWSHLKRAYYNTWANYHLKWLQLMEDNGLPIWAISTGNEPLNGVINVYSVKFMSLGWIPRYQAVWLADFLGPTIRESKFKDLVIFSNDEQRYTLPWWLRTMNKTRSTSLSYINGVSMHWYSDEILEVTFMDRAREIVGNDSIFLNSESCIGDKSWDKNGPLLGSWERGEKYARAFLQDFQHSLNAWIDWNIVLDEEGGPNYVNNTVDAPVILNTTTFTEVYKQPMFYTMGHFSKFVPEDSIRIESARSNVNVDSLAFIRPDTSIALIVFNSGKADVDVTLNDSVRGTILINLPPRSIHTIIYK